MTEKEEAHKMADNDLNGPGTSVSSQDASGTGNNSSGNTNSSDGREGGSEASGEGSGRDKTLVRKQSSLSSVSSSAGTRDADWVPTPEWVVSWKAKLPLQTIMRLLQVLVPQVEKICIDK